LPAAKRSAIQAGEDRNAQRLFCFCDVIDIRFRIYLEIRFVGIIVERFGREFTAISGTAARAMISWTKLFFEERMENHGCRAGVFHPFYIVELFRERRGRWNERRPQFKSKISSG